MTTLHIRQETGDGKKHKIRLILKRAGKADIEGEAEIAFALTPQEQEDLRWYMEDYLQAAAAVEDVQIEQIEALMKQRGEELYNSVLDANQNTRAIWFAIREQLADLRIEITTGIAEAASVPWELMRDPQSDSPIALRVKSFVRAQPNPSIGFVPVPAADAGRIRLLYVVCRPGGRNDVELRAVANRLLQDLGADLVRFDITALRPPTFEQLQKELTGAKAAGHPYHIVHFDGHGVYEDLSKTALADWLKAINALTMGGKQNGKHGYLLFEHLDSAENMRPVSGDELGKLLHDNGVPVLVLNACQSAMHEATGGPARKPTANVHDEVRAIGSLAQAVVDQGIPAVLGMRYSVYVVTAAQYIGQLYAALATGRAFGEAASAGRKHLALNPDRWVGLQPRPLQDWFVPVVYEASPIHLLPSKALEPGLELDRPERDPAQSNPALRRYVPDTGFVGRDETLLLLDRAFDHHPVVLLHAYAGQGKSATAVEFARWYVQTGGLGPQPVVLLSSFEAHTDLTDVLNQIGQAFTPTLQAGSIDWHALNDNAARSRIMLKILQQTPVLWIWNNVEPVAGFPAGTESAWTPSEQADLADFLKQIRITKGTKARILLTSRRDEEAWLGGIPHRIEMPRMRNSDAASLARSLSSGRKITREEIADWQPLLDYCHGNPLTLRVIVGQAIRMGLRGKERIAAFVEAIRSGEQAIEDIDEKQGRDKSLGASLDYGFRHAFKDDELPIIALLYLFQGTVVVDALVLMGKDDDNALPELRGKSQVHLKSLLDRTRDTGLLTHLGGTYYSIHPALSWFLGKFYEQYYDGQSGHSTEIATLRVWVATIGGLGSYYSHQVNEGNGFYLHGLTLLESNLLQARRIALRYDWWAPLVSTMQGLDDLYWRQGRQSEWSRLVAEITSFICTSDDMPIQGREDAYALGLEYRIKLCRMYTRDLSLATALQNKHAAWARKQATPALAVPPDVNLDVDQRSRIRTLVVSIETLGQILRQKGDTACIQCHEEAIKHCQRIGDEPLEAINQYNLGQAYLEVHQSRNLDASEAAFRRELELQKPSDNSAGLAATLCQLGKVYLLRLEESLERGDPKDTSQLIADEADRTLRRALSLCPSFSFDTLAPIHGMMGHLQSLIGNNLASRENLEKAIICYEHANDRYSAGRARQNLAIMYDNVARKQSEASGRRDLLERAQSYAKSALRDYQHYQGRAADMEDTARQLLARIAQALEVLDGGKKGE